MPAIQQSLIQFFKVFRGQDVVEDIDHHKLNNPSFSFFDECCRNSLSPFSLAGIKSLFVG
jgi:hypothetical protein